MLNKTVLKKTIFIGNPPGRIVFLKVYWGDGKAASIGIAQFFNKTIVRLSLVQGYFKILLTYVNFIVLWHNDYYFTQWLSKLLPLIFISSGEMVSIVETPPPIDNYLMIILQWCNKITTHRSTLPLCQSKESQRLPNKSFSKNNTL